MMNIKEVKELFQKEDSYAEKRIEEKLLPYFEKYNYKLYEKENRDNTDSHISNYSNNYYLRYKDNEIEVSYLTYFYNVKEDIPNEYYIIINNTKIRKLISVRIKKIGDMWTTKFIHWYLEAKSKDFSSDVYGNEGNTFEEKVDHLIDSYIQNLEKYAKGVLEGKEWIDGFSPYDGYF